MVDNKSQVSFEYLIIMGFIMFIIIGTLGIALFYSGSIKDQVKMTQLTNCGNKIVSTAESVFYAGQPSKATITCYLPENIKIITILEEGLYFEIGTSSGITKTIFSSNVPLGEGTNPLGSGGGLKKIELTAEESRVVISGI